MAKFPEYKREFKYTSELKKNTAYMLLGHPIGFNEKSREPYIIGAVFAEEMYFWKSVGKEILLKINCPGGSIMDGFSIMDAVRTTDASVQNVGVAASMAVPIMLSARKDKRTAIAYARAMIHPPQGSDKVAVEAMRGSLSNILTETSNFSKSQVEDMLKDGAPDVWLDAKEMKKKGLICEIIPTDMELQGEETDPYAMYKVYNQLIEKEMAETKGVEGDALKAIQDIQNRLDSTNTALKAKDDEITALKAKVAAFEDKEKAEKDAAGKKLVEDAITNKQINIPAENPGLKDQFVKMAIESPDAFKAILSVKPTERKSVVAHMKTAEVEGEETYEFLANHNPKKLYDLMDNEPEKYQKLVNVWTEKVKNNQKVA